MKLQKRKDMAARVMLMKSEAAKLALYKTMHALEEVSRVIGWEIASLEQYKKAKKVK